MLLFKRLESLFNVLTILPFFPQCLDFSVTMYLLHLVFSIMYGGLPHSLAWWITNIVSLVITILVGEFLCMRSELAAIPVTGEAKT